MSNLVPFNNNGLELVIDNTTGESFASISAVARMTDKSNSTINRYVNGSLKGSARMTLKMVEIQTPGGLQGSALLNESQIAQVIKHYKPELLERADELAVRVFLHGLAGYQFTSNAVTSTNDITAMLENNVQLRSDAKCKWRNQGKYVMKQALDRQDAYDPALEATRQIGLIMADTRLQLEPDGSLATPHCINIVVKQFRQTQDAMEGHDSVPVALRPKKEQDDPENALINNPSSKQESLPKLTKEQIATAKKALKQSPEKAKKQSKLAPGVTEGFVIDIPMDDIKY
jgi:hypothetical protein